MQSARPLTPTIALPGGGSVALDGDQAVARNARGEVVLRFDGHTVELVAPGDLRLSAPEGGVTIASRDDVVIEGRAIHQRATREASVAVAGSRLQLDATSLRAEAPRLHAKADEAALHAQHASVIAGRLATTAQQLVQEVERVELRAGKIIERAGDVLREASGLLQQRAGRMRTLVDRGYALLSERTTMRSSEETSIDGKKILLG